MIFKGSSGIIGGCGCLCAQECVFVCVYVGIRVFVVESASVGIRLFVVESAYVFVCELAKYLCLCAKKEKCLNVYKGVLRCIRQFVTKSIISLLLNTF